MKLPSLPLWLEIALAILIALALSNLVTIILLRASGEQRFNRLTADFHAQRVAGAFSVMAQAPAKTKPLPAARSGEPDYPFSQPVPFDRVIEGVAAFVGPVLAALARDEGFDATWSPRGPWKAGR